MAANEAGQTPEPFHSFAYLCLCRFYVLQCFFVEHVPDLFGATKFCVILGKILKEIGYGMDYTAWDSAQFVPQRRRRGMAIWYDVN